MNYLLCAHRLVHGGQDTGGGLRPLVAKSRRPSALAALGVLPVSQRGPLTLRWRLRRSIPRST